MKLVQNSGVLSGRIISLGYNQVIELFPTGGGGYRVATALSGPRAGLVSGAALLVDYVLTVTTSLASGMDAFFSLLPVGAQAFKLTAEILLLIFMSVLNFRGMKGSILVLIFSRANFLTAWLHNETPLSILTASQCELFKFSKA